MASANSILDHIDKPHLNGYSWEMRAFGYEHDTLPHISGHSFRKGGANALRDALLQRGDTKEMVVEYLMKFGRWRSAESLRHYLALTWEQLASAASAVGSQVRWAAGVSVSGDK